MVTDPQAEPQQGRDRMSVVDNEIPTYRAISTPAIASLGLGLLSFLSFANLWFLILAGAAILLGVVAIRKIGRYPDEWTGLGIARAGVGFALAIGLAAATHATVNEMVLRSRATAFAKVLEGQMRGSDFATFFSYHFQPSERSSKSPQEHIDEMLKAMRDPGMFENEFGPVRLCHQKVAAGAEFQFLRLEMVGMDDLTPFAHALYEVHDEKAGTPPEFALVLMKARNVKGAYEWWFDQLVYPYKLGTMGGPAVKIDDGHGH